MDNMSMNVGDTDSEVKNLLLQGFRAAKENRREEAYQLFCDVVARDPNNEHGWLYRAATTDSRSEAYVCLEKVLSINPDNQKAQRGLERIREQQQEESDAEDTDNTPTEAYMAGPAAAAAQERIGGQEYVSNFPPGGKPAPTAGVYDAPAAPPRSAQSTYPFPAEEAAARPTSYPGYAGNDQAPSNYPGYGATPPPPQGYPSYNPTMDTQPRPSYNDNYQPAPSETDYDAAAYGNEGSTDLDRNGENRRRSTSRGLIILIIFLLLIAALLAGFLFLTSNSGRPGGLDQAAIDATSTAGAASANFTTSASSGGTTVTNVAGGNTIAPVTGGTTAAPITGTGNTTAPGGGAVTTAAPNPNTTQAPVATTATNPNTQPAATTIPPPPPPVTTAAPSGGNSNNPAAPTKPILYTVRPGDSLYGIASRNGCSIDSIKAANRYTQPITGNSIFPSNRLIIPVGRPDFRGSGHIVAQGDTLDSIAAKYGTTADAIVKLNGLSSPTDIKIDDPLIIP